MGVKAPLGAADRRRSDGLLINADLQPGSGAWDGIGWLQGIHTMKFRPSLSASLTLVYAYKGTNDEYLGNSQYQFGPEWQARFGLTDRLFLGNAIVDPLLGLRFRRAAADRFNAVEVPSTGGEWIFLNTGFSYWLGPDLALTTRVELPLYARIVGTQVSPSLRLNIGFFKKLRFGNSPFLN